MRIGKTKPKRNGAKKTSSKKRVILSALIVSFIVGLSVTVVVVVYAVVAIRQLPSPDQFSTRQVSQSTKLYDRTGKILLYEIHGEEKRTVVPLSDIPDTLKNATLAAEDSNFYTRPAFDWKGILRAVWTDIKEWRAAAGGSTITQQLARNAFLSGEKTITRKIKELILAIELEAKYPKNDILGFYLNQIPYGSNAYGVEAASQTYFNKPVRDITLNEAAILAGIVKAPSYYSPWGTHTDDLIVRKNYVLDRMAALGFITQQEADAAKKEMPKFAPPSLGSIKAPHFSLAVKDWLIDKYGEDLVTNGGLRVITTLDWSMQQTAEKVVQEGAKRNSELYKGTNAALVAQDPKTGQILALVGSHDYFDTEHGGNFNVPLQGLRQPGSALKPFVYMMAFEKGYLPKTTIFDVPTEFVSGSSNCPPIPSLDDSSPHTECFHPQDFEPFTGPVTLEQALAQSINVPAVKMLYLVGLRNVLDTARSLGISTLTDPSRYGLSLVLGGGEVKMIELVNAYATLSQEGVRHDQTMVLEVSDSNGKILETYRDQNTKVIDPEYPRLINQILSDKELRSGLFQGSLSLTVFPDHDVALKTGTTNDYRDAWAFGYTPSLVVGVWAGNNNNAPMQRQGSSILAAVPMWSDFLSRVLPNYPQELFSKPDPLPTFQKPMLSGQFVYDAAVGGEARPQIHSILYYVDKNDPTGPIPKDPSEDPQFTNWEAGVLNWAQKNVSSFSSFNKSIPLGAGASETGGNITIQNVVPSNGSFVVSPFRVRADIRSINPIQTVGVYINDIPVTVLDGISQTHYYLDYQTTQTLDPQNTLEIRAVDSGGKAASSKTIVYRR